MKSINQGLYKEEYEHDACGIGGIASIDGKKSHQLIDDALDILIHLEHRGGTGLESNSGDGAGILFQIPDEFFRSINLGFELPKHYGVAQVFFNRNNELYENSKELFLNITSSTGLEVLGVRNVPYNDFDLGSVAKDCMPKIVQIFIKKPDNEDSLTFERHLYLTRRLIEKKVIEEDIKDLYISSMSSKTIVYKGMLVSTQVKNFYSDLNNLKLKSAIATVHSRFSTNTFPSWSKAHPYRLICHNGEINTIKGNVNGIKAREGLLKSDVFKDHLSDILPIIANPSSDSAMLDNVIEFLVMNGRSLEEAITLLIPEAWTKNVTDKKLRSYYEFNSTFMEPWDGPAALIFTDGEKLGVTLDRNGLRPARYAITKDNYFIVYSETGALPLKEENIKHKSRVEAGTMLVVDTINHKIYNNEEIKKNISSKENYELYKKEIIKLKKDYQAIEEYEEDDKYNTLLKQFRYTTDSINNGILYLANHNTDRIIAMGKETPLSILSNKIPLLFDFFQQNFAQVTNPPIDSIREYNITSERIYVGCEGNLIHPSALNARRIKLECPIISLSDLKQIEDLKEFKTKELDITYNPEKETLKEAIDNVSKEALNAIDDGYSILVITDKNITKDYVSIPSLLALSSIHIYLTRKSKRTHASIIVDSFEPRDIHHFACLIGYGATAVCPRMSFNVINNYAKKRNIDPKLLINNYIESSAKGIVKIMSKMGISSIQSYNGAQIFEALGLSKELVDEYFPGTTSAIGGIGLEELSDSILENYRSIKENKEINYTEDKIFDKETIRLLQESTRENDYKKFKEYSAHVNNKLINITDLFDITYKNSIPIEDVESVESLVKRFSTGAMSFGSISEEAHKAMAEAMNILHASSNSGEGGEVESRYDTIYNSNIKQVASSRFGVTIEYLNSAKEIQIKVAQGAKPGEGGNLPKNKVYPAIAKARHSTPGVSLISPPPHHDIYSIEDLAQLIYDLKSVNPDAIISVKLVSEAGVGTVSSGVVKAGANKILISGFNGGTGAASRTSIPHAGMPYEIGLAETHQTLILNNLRKLVKLEVDGKLLTGKDVIVAGMLGADLFSFSTAPLITLGCQMLKVCNLNTCPFGVATQDPKLREKFQGKATYVVNFMKFIASEVREIMAKLGFKSFDDLIGHVEYLNPKSYRNIDLKNVLYKPNAINKTLVHFEAYKPHNEAITLDYQTILPFVREALKNTHKLNLSIKISNTNRALGSYLSHYVVKNNYSLEKDFITIDCYGNAGNSFGSFLTKGINLNIIGDANDYLGKSLSGGVISVRQNELFDGKPNENIIAGNVILYGATSGEVYIDGVCGERFGVRLSGAKALAISIGNHGAEYMTGGSLIVLDKVGKNFMSGASGGVSYIRNTKENIMNINPSSVSIEEVTESDYNFIKDEINNHIKYTNSSYATSLLKDISPETFIKVIPNEYKAMLSLLNKYKNEPDASILAFKELINQK